MINLLFCFELLLGISGHTRADYPEFTGHSPFGIVRVEHKPEHRFFEGRTIAFCEHVSSIPTTEDGYGLNHCGVLVKF